jgi:hypothetical protein
MAMTGPKQSEHDNSTTSGAEGPALRQLRTPSPLDQVRAQKAQETAREERRLLQKEKAGFKAWKKLLCHIIQTESTMVRNQDGSYSYVLPSRIVHLVYEVMIKERIKLKGCSREEAENAVRHGFVEAADKFEKVQTSVEAAKAEHEEQGEAEAAAKLAEMRAELVGEQ